MLIRIATAECFTHGKIASEIHAFSRGYPLSYHWRISPKKYPMSLLAGLFIPTLSGIESVLNCSPLNPVAIIDDIKIYNQDQDIRMAKLMGESVKQITGADIGIGTTAGIGKGAYSILYDEGSIDGTSDYNADLVHDPHCEIFKRQSSGIENCLKDLEFIIENHFIDTFPR